MSAAVRGLISSQLPPLDLSPSPIHLFAFLTLARSSSLSLIRCRQSKIGLRRHLHHRG